MNPTAVSPFPIESLLHSLNAVIWTAVPHTLQYEFVSPQLDQWLGQPASGILGEPFYWDDHIHPDDQAQARAQCQAIVHHHGEGQIIYRLVTANGRILWVQDTIRYLTAPIPQLCGIKTNITAAKEQEQATRHHAELLREFTRIISANLDYESVIHKGTNYLHPILQFQHAAIYLSLNSDTLEFIHTLHYENDIARTHTDKNTPTALPALFAKIQQELKPIRYHTIKDHPQWDPPPGFDTTTALLTVPMIRHGQLIGILLFGHETPGRFALIDLNLVADLIENMAIAVENAWLFETTQRLLSHKTTLLEAGAAVSSSLDITTVLSRLAEQLCHAIAATSVYISDWSTQTGQSTVLTEYYTPAASAAERVSDLGQTYNLYNLYPNELHWLLNNQPNVTSLADLNLSERTRQHMLQYNAKSILSIPLWVNHEPVGYIELWESRYQRQFTENEIALCQDIAAQAAIAMANVQRYQANKRRRRSAEILNEITGYLTSTLELDEVLHRTVTAVQGYLSDIHNCAISFLEPDGRHLRNYVQWNALPDYNIVNVGDITLLADTYASRLVIETLQPVIIPDIPNLQELTPTIKKWITLGLQSLLYIPIIIYNKPIGILHVHVFNNHRVFSNEEIAFCQNVANQTAIAIENARLYQQTRQNAIELDTLHQIATATASTMDIDQLLQQTTEIISQTLYPHIFGFALTDKNTGRLAPHRAAHGVPPETFNELPSLDKSIIDQVVRTGKPYLSNNVLQDPFYHAILTTTRSQVSVPLIVYDKVIGAINAESDKINAYSENDIRFLSTLAGQVATAIERAKLYETLEDQANTLARKVAERTIELQTERDRTYAILESAGEGILLTDVKAQIIYANPAVERQSGYTRAELMHQNPNILRSKDTPPAIFEEMWRTILNSQRWSGEVVNQRKDGTLYDVVLTINPVLDPDGGLSGFVGIQSDISHLKELDRLKSQFVSNVSHELRTPLTNIKTYVTLIERGKEEKRPHYFNVLHHETDRLAQLIQDLLDLSRLETEPLPDPNISTLVPLTAKEIYQIFAPKGNLKKINFQLDADPDLPPARIEPRHLNQLFMNLIGNAIAYTPENGRIHIQAQNQPEAHTLQIRVTNTGEGIPPEDIPNLFTRFFRGRNALEKGVPGTGLGLAICQEIVTRYGGKIEIENVPNSHITFVITLSTF